MFICLLDNSVCYIGSLAGAHKVENRSHQRQIGNSKPSIIGHQTGQKAKLKKFQKNFKKSQKKP
jgi:hypothetical protein